MPIITPAQCRAARAWVRLTQRELADKSGISLPTLINFERENMVPGEDVLKSLVKSLRKAGVVPVFDSADVATGIQST